MFLRHIESTSLFSLPVSVLSAVLTTTSVYRCGNATIFFGFDMMGNDIASNSVVNYTMCCFWCRSFSGCSAFTYGLTESSVPGICYLKNPIPATTVGGKFDQCTSLIIMKFSFVHLMNRLYFIEQIKPT